MTIKLESLDLEATAVEFDLHYVCIDGKSYSGEDDWRAFVDKYPDRKRSAAVSFDDYGDEFYLCYFANCAAPPVSIVRAADMIEARDKFIDAAPGNRLNDEEVARIEGHDGSGQTTLDGVAVDLTGDGWWYFTETLEMRQVQVTKILV